MLTQRSLQETVDGFEVHIGTNHIGHFHLFRGLEPALVPSRARVVMVSTGWESMPPWVCRVMGKHKHAQMSPHHPSRKST